MRSKAATCGPEEPSGSRLTSTCCERRAWWFGRVETCCQRGLLTAADTQALVRGFVR